MTQGAARALEKTGPLAADMVKKLNAGEVTVAQMLSALGPVAVAEFQQTIVDIDSPENAPSTVAAKKTSNPLVASSLMTQTLTYIVRNK